METLRDCVPPAISGNFVDQNKLFFHFNNENNGISHFKMRNFLRRFFSSDHPKNATMMNGHNNSNVFQSKKKQRMILKKAPTASITPSPIAERHHMMVNNNNNQLLPNRHASFETFPVVALCTAEAYNFPKMLTHLQQSNSPLGLRICPTISEDVIHLQSTPAGPGDGDSSNLATNVFVFKNGSFVTWAPPDPGSFLLTLREQLRPFEINPTTAVETEQMEVRLAGPGEPVGVVSGETLVVGDCVRTMVAFSNGLADSVKLAVLEGLMETYIEQVRDIPAMLESRGGGRLPLTRAQVLSLTGQLLRVRALLNLHSSLLDPPELYWSEPELEPVYLRITRFLDIRQRVSVLNKMLDYANELAHVLRSHLSEQHGLKLEWGIIALIAVEVAFETVHWIERIFA